MLFTTVTRNGDVAVSKSDASVTAGHKVEVTAVTRESDKFTGECKSVSFRDTARSPDVSPCALVVTLPNRFSGQFLQSLDTLNCDTHA